jgi:hypothetical protein
VFFTLGEFGFKSKRYRDSERYYENVLYILDNVDKMFLIREMILEKKETQTKLKKVYKNYNNLVLNQKYFSINNKLIEVGLKTGNWENCLAYITNNYF